MASFPEEMERIVAFIQEPVSQAAVFALKGDVPLHTLHSTADRMEQELRQFEDISRIESFGVSSPEIEISVDETTLRQYGLTFEEISRAVAAENIQVTGGQIRGPHTRFRIRLNEKENYAKGLRNIVVRSRADGSRVYLHEVATVRDAFSEDPEQAYLDGERAVYITVNSTNEENVQLAVDRVKAYLQTFNENNNSLEAVLVNDATLRLDDRISVLKNNGLLGFILVLILLGLFLRIRLAFWVALGIPISFCGMFVLALYYGVTLNFFSLFGMIIVLGILVDDGIVVGENIYQKYQEGLPPIRAAVEGTLEVAHAVFSAVLTTILALSFFYFIPARIGDMFSDVSFMVSAALLVSLVEVMILLPAHLAHSKALHREKDTNMIQDRIADGVLRFRDKFYIPLLRFALQYKVLVFLITLSLLVLTFASIRGGIISTTFFPNLERNEVEVTMKLKQGINEKITKQRAEQIITASERLNRRYRDRFTMEQDLFQHTELRIGPESNQASIIFYLLPSEEREIRSFDIAADLRKEAGPIPEVDQLSYTREMRIGKPVEISLISSDYESLQGAADSLKKQLANLSELRDIIDNQNINEPVIGVRLKEQARSLGFNNRELIRQIRSGFFGQEVQRLQRGQNEIKVWVRYALEDRRSLEDLKDMFMRNDQGNTYPVRELANLEFRHGPVTISHRAGRREIKVEAEMASRRASAPVVVEEIRSNIMPEITRQFPGVDYLFEGQIQQSREVFKAASTVLPVLLILIFAVIVFAFRSVMHSVLLFILIPFGLIGAVWGHFFHDIAIGILSLMGFIALVGILVNDGLVFVTTFNSKLRQGLSFDKSLMETGRARFRPILLTSLTTAVGLAPLIFERSFQAQFLIPMAVSVAYGLLFTTFLLLAVLPILITWVNSLKRWTHWIWTGEWVARESVEPAIQNQRWEEENV